MSTEFQQNVSPEVPVPDVQNLTGVIPPEAPQDGPPVEEAEFVFDADFVPATPSSTPWEDGDYRLTQKQKRERDQKEAERIVEYYFDGDIFRFPSSGKAFKIRRLPEAARTRFIWEGEKIQPPRPPKKTIVGRKGRRIETDDYENQAYLRAVDAYTAHKDSAFQNRIGQMMEYICYAGTEIIDTNHYESWEEYYEDGLPSGISVSDSAKRYIYFTELARNDAEWKALLIAICGVDPLAQREESDEEDD